MTSNNVVVENGLAEEIYPMASDANDHVKEDFVLLKTLLLG